MADAQTLDTSVLSVLTAQSLEAEAVFFAAMYELVLPPDTEPETL